MSDEERVLETDAAALLFDVHGNAAALAAVLGDVADRGIEQIVFGGDYASSGPRPQEAVRRSRLVAAAAIRGNTDEWVTGLEEAPEEGPFEWTQDHLTSEQVDWLEERPFGCRLRPEGDGDEGDDLLVVHANPVDTVTPMHIEDHPHEAWTATSDEKADQLLGEAEANLVAYGHIHNPAAGELARRRVKSLGSVGLPWDGDPRAAYGIAEWGGQQWAVEDVRVEYDRESVAEELERSQAPGSEAAAESLREASFGPMA